MDIHQQDTQPYHAEMRQQEPGESSELGGSGRRVMDEQGQWRRPTSQEEEWMAEYDREQEEQERMDELLAQFQQEEEAEEAYREWEAQQEGRGDDIKETDSESS